jgi:hypothetical protein
MFHAGIYAFPGAGPILGADIFSAFSQVVPTNKESTLPARISCL